MISKQNELVLELQAAELTRFQSLQDIYQQKSRNPLGLRFANLERAFNIVAASKLVGWPSGLNVDEFLDSVCEIVCDYVSGPFVVTLSPAYQVEIANPTQAESWFDYAQIGLYLGMFAGSRDTVTAVSRWVAANMRTDPGIEEVSPAINVLYEQICGLLRGEALASSFPSRFEAGIKLKRERFLAEMIVAIADRNLDAFKRSIESHIAAHSGNSLHAQMHEIISVDASILCCTWGFLNGNDLSEFSSKECIYFRNEGIATCQKTPTNHRARDSEEAK